MKARSILILALAIGCAGTLKAQTGFTVNNDGTVNSKSLTVTGTLVATQAGFGYVPIGTILPWYNVSASAALPPGWYKCNGQSVSVPVGSEADLLDGVSNGTFATPNLNASPGFAGRGLFLRGGNTAGVYQDDMFRSHSHIELGPVDGALTPSSGDFNVNGGEGLQGRSSGAAGGEETRPANMSVVWIIRVQ